MRMIEVVYKLQQIFQKPSHQSTPIRINKSRSKCKAPQRILNINFQSIKNKQHLVHNILDSLKPDFVIGTETWLDPNITDAEAFFDEYKLYRRDRKVQQGGGVLLAINKNFISDEVEELHPGNECEIIWTKLEIKGSKTLYISSFYNPKTSDEKSLKNVDILSVRRASQIKNVALFIGGDLNLLGWDWKNKNTKTKRSPFKKSL